MPPKAMVKVETNIHLNTFARCAAILLLSGFLTWILLGRLWETHIDLWHTVVELICIFFFMSAFVDTWHTYYDISSLNRLIGFSLLVIAIMNILHVLLFINLVSFSSNYLDLSMKFLYAGGFFEILLLYITASSGFDIRLGKGAIMGLTLAACLFIGLLMYCLSFITPSLCSSGKITDFKYMMDILLFIAAVIAAVKTALRLHRNCPGDTEKTILKYTYFALIMFIFARICFFMSKDIHDATYAFGHVLRVIYSFFLYSAVYKTTIKYPYMKLKEVNEENKIILNSATVGMVNFDASDKISFVNSQCEKMMGYTQERLLGISYKDFVEKFINLHAEAAEPARKAVGGRESREFVCTCNTGKGGSVKLVATLISMKHRKIVVLRDAKKQQALENMQLQTQTILNALENPVLVMDTHSRIIMCNKCFETLVEIPAHEVIGKKMGELDDRVRLRVVKVTNADRLEECYIGSLEAEFTTASGREKRVIINSSLIKNVDGEIIGYISVTPDITDVKNEHERIQQQEKLALIGQMAAGLVHEIKNPLASIKGFTQLVKHKSRNEKILEYSAVIENAAEDINRIVSDFLMFSKPLPVKLQNVSVNMMVSSLELIIAGNAFKNSVVTSFSYCRNEKCVTVDERQIKQVVLNIAENALHALNGVERPVLHISTSYDESNDKMQISIRDNGIGMSAEQLGKVGTPFYTTKEKGTGLGMSICNYIINEHGGEIAVESKLYGGTTFIIKLPCR